MDDEDVELGLRPTYENIVCNDFWLAVRVLELSFRILKDVPIEEVVYRGWSEGQCCILLSVMFLGLLILQYYNLLVDAGHAEQVDAINDPYEEKDQGWLIPFIIFLSSHGWSLGLVPIDYCINGLLIDDVSQSDRNSDELFTSCSRNGE